MILHLAKKTTPVEHRKNIGKWYYIEGLVGL
jgi:hypothetical protein